MVELIGRSRLGPVRKDGPCNGRNTSPLDLTAAEFLPYHPRRVAERAVLEAHEAGGRTVPAAQEAAAAGDVVAAQTEARAARLASEAAAAHTAAIRAFASCVRCGGQGDGQGKAQT